MELQDYFRGLRRHWLAVLLMTVLGVGAAAGWTAIQTPVYETTASGIIQATAVSAADETLSLIGDSQARAKVETYLEMSSWQMVADGAVELAGLSISGQQAFARVTVLSPADTAVLRVTAQGPTPEEAAALADAWIVALSSAIDQFEGDGTEGSAPLNITVASPASLPTSPLYPDPQTALIIGAILGLGFGVGFALVRTVSDRRIRTAADVEEHAQIPVIGSIPVSEALGGESRIFTPESAKGKGVGFAVSEALRSMRTNLQFMDVDNPPRILVVTSPLPSDGKSTIAANLALTLAANGQKVVLVDGDLRRSTVAETMGLPGGAGLSDVLSGRARIADVLQRTQRSENLYILPAGSTPPNPSEVLGSDRMRSLLADLATHAFVLIDAPPLLAVTDGAVLTHQADGAVLVITTGKTTYELLDRALDALRKSNGRPLGLVLNRVPTRGADASAYSYEYRREYGTSTTGQAAPATEPADAAEGANESADELFPWARSGAVPSEDAGKEATVGAESRRSRS